MNHEEEGAKIEIAIILMFISPCELINFLIIKKTHKNYLKYSLNIKYEGLNLTMKLMFEGKLLIAINSKVKSLRKKYSIIKFINWHLK